MDKPDWESIRNNLWIKNSISNGGLDMPKVKYVNFTFFEDYPPFDKDRVDMYNVAQRDDVGFGELYQQLKVTFDDKNKIVSVEIIEGPV
jgi:hypothetical protein